MAAAHLDRPGAGGDRGDGGRSPGRHRAAGGRGGPRDPGAPRRRVDVEIGVDDDSHNNHIGDHNIGGHLDHHIELVEFIEFVEDNERVGIVDQPGHGSRPRLDRAVVSTALATTTLASTSPYLWYSSRATGTVALVLLTGSVVLGLLTSARAGSGTVPRFAVAHAHRAVSLLASCFLAAHIVTAVADTFVPVGWWAAVVPFVSGYSPLWIGLGTVAFDLLIAVTLTSLVRDRMSAGIWRAVHWLAYACYPLAVAHTIGVGTDLRFTWMDVVTGLCLAAVLAALAWRVWAHPRRGGALTARPTVLAGRPAVGAGRR
jgi:sulfoxide reductase heme-binding subunit YedZ